jgi:hypothetical protein
LTQRDRLHPKSAATILFRSAARSRKIRSNDGAPGPNRPGRAASRRPAFGAEKLSRPAALPHPPAPPADRRADTKTLACSAVSAREPPRRSRVFH